MDALETFLRRRLREPRPGAAAQWRFAPVSPLKGWSPDLTPPEARRAAALILLYPESGVVHFPLTVRRDDLPHHGGQVSLPGGAVDPGERPEDAAIREAHEEIGIDPAAVTIVGSLSSLWVIVSNFVLEPFVGICHERPSFTPEPREVAALVEAPLGDLRDASRLHWHRAKRGGVLIDFPYFDLAGHRVWGATAMVLGEFACLWDERMAPPPRTDGFPGAGAAIGAENRDGSSGVNLVGAPTAVDYVVTTSPPLPGGTVKITYEASASRKGTYDLKASMTSNIVRGTAIRTVRLVVD